MTPTPPIAEKAAANTETNEDELKPEIRQIRNKNEEGSPKSIIGRLPSHPTLTCCVIFLKNASPYFNRLF